MGKDELTKTEQKMSLKQKQAAQINYKYRIVRFLGTNLIFENDRYKPIDSHAFASIAYEVLGSQATKNQINDLEHYFFAAADDISHMARYILLGDNTVWDRKKLKLTQEVAPEDCVFRCTVTPTYNGSHRNWLEQLSLSDKALADDMMWAIAPIFMEKKPFGVFWFLGDGSNGKSTLLKTVYQLFGGKDQAPFTRLSLTAIEDGRDTPTINGKLGNICIESHDGHIKDAGNYKHLADHDDFEVHRMRANGNITVNGNIHTIFNTNNIPTFGDKSKAIRDRTFTIPFKAEFERDMTFDDKLWSQEGFLGDFLGELLETTVKLKKNGYKYNLSPLSLSAKADYDEEANSADSYLKELISQEIIAFNNFSPLYDDYETWCKERGAILLGRRTLATAAKNLGYERKILRDIQNNLLTRYVHGNFKLDEMTEVTGHWGLYQKADSDIELGLVETNDSLNQLLELDM